MKAPYAAGAAMRAAASYRNADPLVGRLQSVCISLSRVLDALDAAIAADQERRFEDEWEAVRTAIGIIQTLDRTLDMESGGEVARSLRNSYQNSIRALHALVRVADGAEGYRRIRDGMAELRQAWGSIRPEALTAGA